MSNFYSQKLSLPRFFSATKIIDFSGGTIDSLVTPVSLLPRKYILYKKFRRWQEENMSEISKLLNGSALFLHRME